MIYHVNEHPYNQHSKSFHTVSFTSDNKKRDNNIIT